MNKKILIIILLVLFVPTVLAALWFYSVSGAEFNPSNVSEVRLSNDEDEWIFTEDTEKEFFTSVVNNFEAIERQTFSADVWTLYTLELERIFETSVFYLCLSPDAKNCLAYDSEGEWYRIDTSDARKFLTREELEGIYTSYTYPKLAAVFSGEAHDIEPREYEWSYLLANGDFSTTSNKDGKAVDTGFNVPATTGFDISFSIMPDWCDVKIFDGDALVFSGDLSSFKSFSYDRDATLRTLVSASWYEDDSHLYYGTTVTEFTFNYNVRATAEANKYDLIPGEVAWITIENGYNETFRVETNLDTSDTLTVREHQGKHYLALPVSMNNKTGEYNVSIVSDGSNIQLKFTVSERLLEDAKVKLLTAGAHEYETALESFENEINLSSYKTTLTEPLWKGGFVTPVIKFDENNKECYWISAPSYGVEQIVDGMKISTKNFGTHYVKSVEFEFIKARAVADGIIAFSGETSAFGNTLVIDHGFGLYTVYGHLEDLSHKSGDTVKQYDVIGHSSNGGIVMKNGQLFFAILQDGVFVNPYMLINEQKSADAPDTTLAPIEF